MVILITKLGVWTETSHQAAVEFCSRLEESFLKQRKRELKWDVSDRGWTEGGVQQRTKEVLWVIQSYSSWIQEQKYAGSKWNRTSFKRDFFSLLIYSYTHTHLLQQLTSNRLLTRTNDPISLLHSEPGDDVVQLIRTGVLYTDQSKPGFLKAARTRMSEACMLGIDYFLYLVYHQ